LHAHALLRFSHERSGEFVFGMPSGLPLVSRTLCPPSRRLLNQ
jgi:hypothetical protein